MLKRIVLNPENIDSTVEAFLQAWSEPDLKVFVLKSTGVIADVKGYFGEILPMLGTPATIAEDVRVGDRSNQRTGEVWMEVRNDANFPDAYRHSVNAQPLHTDGSYVSDFPNAGLLACAENSVAGGETIFLDGADLISALEDEASDLLKQLLETVVPHARSGDRREYPIIRCDRAHPLLNWNYYCVDEAVTDRVRHLKDRFHQYLQRSPRVLRATIQVKLLAGDAVVWKDAEVLHGRNSFQATKASDRFLWKCGLEVGSWR